MQRFCNTVLMLDSTTGLSGVYSCKLSNLSPLITLLQIHAIAIKE